MDLHDANKKNKCRDLLQQINVEHSGVISTQVLQEFYVTATQKLNADPLIIKNILHSLRHSEIVQITPELIENAIDILVSNKVSFWDALIISSAEHAHCEFIYTEDLNDGQVIRGIKIINPLNFIQFLEENYEN